jgi:NAD(P)-dependent dehydrogenase (short-subunit alcohol dehydrogenase family)
VHRLKDRGVIVTGATGIAAASARLFAAEGARVMIVSRTESSCVELVDAITTAGGTASYAVADLTSATESEAAASAAIETQGRVDGLFNVAGGSGRRHGDGPLHEITAEGWEYTMRLNASSHVFLTAAILRFMLAQERGADRSRGAIVNMSSVLAAHPVPDLFATHAYAAAKGAIRSLTVASAAYYAPHRHPHQRRGARADHVTHVTASRHRRSHRGVLTTQAAAREWLHRGRGRGLPPRST